MTAFCPEARIKGSTPRIGLNMSLARTAGEDGGGASVPMDYMDAVANAGGIPLCIPPLEGTDAIRAVLPVLDAFLFIGGADYRPERYGGYAQPDHELVDVRRDRFDTALAKIILEETDLPVLGICGGLQLLVIACGGALIQDIRTQWFPSQGGPSLAHAKNERRGRQARSFLHVLTFRENSLVARSTGSDPATGIRVNSFHHQSASPENVGEGLCASAWSSDGIIEAVEPAPDSAWTRSGRFLLGVQWHPERMQERPEQRRLFRSLIEAAAGRRP